MDSKKMEFSKWELDFFDKLDAFSEQYKPLSDAADALGLSFNTFNSYKYRLRHPKHSTVEKVLSIIEGEKPKQPVIKRVGLYAQRDVVKGENLPEVPVHMSAGAGQPVNEDVWTSEPTRTIQILPQYYQQNMVMVEVMGDSMEPTIRRGGFVGVVPFDGALHEGAIYLVRRPPFGLLVKRIRSNKDGEILLISDNPQYEPQVVPPDEYESIVVGKVVWSLQMV